MKHRIVEIGGCVYCPICIEVDGKWHCDGTKRCWTTVLRTKGMPRWCPLRRGDIVLRLKKEA